MCRQTPQMKTEESPGLLMGLVVHGRSGDGLFFLEDAVGETYTHQSRAEQSTVLVDLVCWGGINQFRPHMKPRLFCAALFTSGVK